MSDTFNIGVTCFAFMRRSITTQLAAHFQKGNPSKINLQKVANLSAPKYDHQLTTNHHDSTTNSPSKNHIKPPIFAKTHCKTRNIRQNKIPLKVTGEWPTGLNRPQQTRPTQTNPDQPRPTQKLNKLGHRRNSYKPKQAGEQENRRTNDPW
jgi:hypothetical protein